MQTTFPHWSNGTQPGNSSNYSYIDNTITNQLKNLYSNRTAWLSTRDTAPIAATKSGQTTNPGLNALTAGRETYPFYPYNHYT
jgi:hypothetical protein